MEKFNFSILFLFSSLLIVIKCEDTANLTTEATSPNVTTSTEDPIVALKIGQFTPECREQLFKTDQCMAEAIFLGSTDIPDIPTTPDEIDFYCSRAKVTYDCVNNYRKCLKLFPKTFFGIVARDVKKTMKKTCSTAGKAEVIKHLKCFDKSNVDTMYKIMNGFSKVLNHIADEVDPNDMIPNLCCSYQYMYDEGVKLVQEQCSSRTGPSTAKYVMNMVESVLASAVDLGCGKHNSLAVCKSLMPKEMELFVNLTMIGQMEEIKYTPVIPMLKIAQNLDSSLTI